MTTLLIFGAALFAAALISDLAHRSIVSTSVLFLVVGYFAGPEFLGAIRVTPKPDIISTVAQFAMFTILFTDGMELDLREFGRAWRLPALALGIGLPLTVGGTAVLAHWIGGLGWVESLLVGAVLAPTDPVFASAIVGRREIPARLRDLLNIESGLNDGLALPFVLVLLDLATGRPLHPWRVGFDLALGAALGVAVPWLGHRLEQLRAFTVSQKYEPLFALSLGLLVYAAASLTGVNLFVGAFAAGVTVATVQPRFRRKFCDFGETVSELLKLATVMLFGALLSEFLPKVPLTGYAFAALALLVARPVALEIALHWAVLPRTERIAAYWFGPKGFASMVYGIMVLRSGLPNGPILFRLIGVVVAFSIVAHSSTDVIVARWFTPKPRRSPPPEATAAGAG